MTVGGRDVRKPFGLARRTFQEVEHVPQSWELVKPQVIGRRHNEILAKLAE